MTRRRRSAPVLERVVPESQQARRERAKLMADVKRLEWEFDKNSTLQVAGQLASLRRDISRLEAVIAEASEESAIRAQIARVEAIAARSTSSAGDAEHGSLAETH